MKITNVGRGIHTREIKGIDRLMNDLPGGWYGFTNLDLVLGAGKARETMSSSFPTGGFILST
jgi:hypothetical protein